MDKHTRKQAEELKGKFNINDISKQINQVFGTLTEQTKQLADEVVKIHRPKDKKDIVINGQACSMSLIEDGRVVITFPSKTASEDYYKEPPIVDNKMLKSFEHESFLKGKAAKMNEISNLPWYKKIWL